MLQNCELKAGTRHRKRCSAIVGGEKRQRARCRHEAFALYVPVWTPVKPYVIDVFAKPLDFAKTRVKNRTQEVRFLNHYCGVTQMPCATPLSVPSLCSVTVRSSAMRHHAGLSRPPSLAVPAAKNVLPNAHSTYT